MTQDKPKFIYLSLNAPHDPVSAPQVTVKIFLEIRVIYFFLITFIIFFAFQELIDEMKRLHPMVTESRAEYLASVKGMIDHINEIYTYFNDNRWYKVSNVTKLK